jgi:outer membrane protein
MISRISTKRHPANSAFALCCGLVIGVGAVQADEAVPSNSIRLGAYFVQNRASAPDVSGPFTPAGINLSVDNLTASYIAYLRRLNDHWSVELAAGIPPTSTTTGKGPAMVGSVPFNGQQVATAKWFSPSLMVEYSFRDEQEALRPYVGLGVNYTKFFDRVSTPAGDAANGGPTSISLSDSVGPAATIGLSYRINRSYNINASYSVARISSNYSSNTAGIIRTTSIDFNPASAIISVGYLF